MVLPPRAMRYETTPPVPLPRASPPMRRNVVPARKDGVHENPVPVFPLGSVVIEPCGMAYDCPPGIIPKILGVLRERKMCYTKEKKYVAIRTLLPFLHPTIFVCFCIALSDLKLAIC